MSDDPICNRCGEPRSKHELDQMTLEPTKCPVSGKDEDDIKWVRDPERHPNR